MTLLHEANRHRAENDERERGPVRERLRAALAEFLPAGSRVWVYGSLTRPGRFREWSDVDLALEAEPAGRSIYLLMSLLAGWLMELALAKWREIREPLPAPR